MPQYTFFTEEGRISHQLTCAESDLDLNQFEGMSYIEGFYDANKFYIENGQAKEKTPMNPTVSGTTISGLPAGTIAIIDGRFYDVGNDGEIEFEFDQPGPHRVRLMSLRHLDKEVVLP